MLTIRWLAALPLCASPWLPPALGQEGAFGLRSVPFDRVQLEGAAWRGRVGVIERRVLPRLQERFEAEGYVANFDVAAGAEGAHNGRREADAECYKWLEAVAAILHHTPDSPLGTTGRAWIERIAAAQEKDGYLATWYQVNLPRRRFRELGESLELHAAGQLIDAGLAWKRVTGEEELLGVARRLADLLAERFGYDGLLDPPGFPGIESSLIRLAAATGDERYRELALFWIEQRGHEDRRRRYGDQAQDLVPILTEPVAVGHAVRGLRLYDALAEVARTFGYEDYRVAAQSVWNDVFRRKMYVTGGVGSVAETRSFGAAYELPLETAWCETCAAAAMLRLNQNLLLLSGHAAGAEIVELELYNALPAAISLDGERFFRDNPMLSQGGSHRVERLEETCCLTELARTLPRVGGTIWAHTDRSIYVAQYVASTAAIPLRFGEVGVRMETDYPESGSVRIVFQPRRTTSFTLHVRIPGWCTGKVSLGAEEVLHEVTTEHGSDPGTWLKFERDWKPGDVFRIEFPLEPERIEASPRVAAQRGRVALRRGPEVYCLEAVDNQGLVFDRYLPAEAGLTASWTEDVLGGVHVIEARARGLRLGARGLGFEEVPLRAVPYRLWNNRGPGPMAVWIPENPDLCELPGESGAVFQGDVAIHASHVDRHTTLRALTDGVPPRDSRDHLVRRATFEPHRGTEEWVRYDFAGPRLLEGSAVYWFDEGEEGPCRAPVEWRLEWLDGATWREVSPTEGGYGTALDRPNVVRFRPVSAASIRLRLQLAPGFSGGILEWEVLRTPGDDR